MSFRSNGVVVVAAITAFLVSALLVADEVKLKDLQTDVITSVPRSMTYQGILKDGDGEGIPDSFFDVTFRIFDAETGGNQEWSETISNIETDGEGRFTTTFANVDLGFDEDYWLEMEIESEVLTPRQKLNMTPFAGASVVADYAWDANMLAGNSSDYYATADHAHSEAAGWVDDGPAIRLETSNDEVGIGTASPQAKLHVATPSAGPWGIIYGQNTGNNNYGYLGGSSYGAFGSGNTAGVYGIHPASGNLGYLGSSAYGLYASALGVGTLAGYFNGKVQINDDLVVLNNISAGTTVTTTSLETAAFRMNNGALNGYVLTSDAAGYGTWQALNAIGGSGTNNYIPRFNSANSVTNSIIFDNGTNVGIGIISPSSKLDVNGSTRLRGSLVVDGDASIANAIDAYRITIDHFQKIGGALAGYVLTSDASGNGTWQALPSSINSETIGQLESKLNEMMGIIEVQNAKIEQLENKLANLEKNR